MTQPPIFLTKSDLARRHIQGMILSGHARSGDRITTREVSQALGISETPIREAIKSLAADGWLEIQTHVGAVVARFGGEQITEIYALRGLIGALSVELSGPSYDTSRLDAIDANIEAASEAVEKHDVARYSFLNNEFHTLLCDTPASQWCQKILFSLRAQTAIHQGFEAVPQRLAASLAEHKLIRDAVRAGDFASAAELIKQHEHAAGEALINELAVTRSPKTATGA